MAYPKRNPHGLTGSASYDAVHQVFRARGHQLQKLTDPDQGRDALVVITLPSGETPGYHVGLQIKTVTGERTREQRAFKFTFETSNIEFLASSTEPNYYMIHDPESGYTYWREAHEIVNFLNQCKPAWREQDHVTLTVFTDNVLDAGAVDTICDEAKAWATERVAVAEDVKYITNTMMPLIYSREIVGDSPDGSYVWAGGSGVVKVRSLHEYLQAIAVTGNIQAGSYLCRVFRERAKAYFPPQHVLAEADTARSFRQLAFEIQGIVARHKRFLADIPAVVAGISPEPLDELERAPTDRPPGVVIPTDPTLAQDQIVDEMVSQLARLGLGVERTGGAGLDLLLDCDGVRGFLALRLYKSRARAADLDRVRQDVRDAQAVAGGIVIELCQIEEMQMNRRPRPAVEPTPKIPIGTTLPIVPDLIADLLDHAGQTARWSNQTLRPREEYGGFLHWIPPPPVSRFPSSRNSGRARASCIAGAQRVISLHGKAANARAGFLDHDDGPAMERSLRPREDGAEALDHMRTGDIGEAEDDDAGPGTPAPSRDLTEVQIEGRDDALFRDSLLEDLAIRKAL